MTCSNCERDIPVDAVFCPYCGYKQIVHANDHAFVVETLDENLEKTDDFENSELTNKQSELACNQPNFTRHKEKKKGFKWFHFIIYFQIYPNRRALYISSFINHIITSFIIKQLSCFEGGCFFKVFSDRLDEFTNKRRIFDSLGR